MIEQQHDIRVRAARLADDAILAALDAMSWSPESGFPSVIDAPASRTATFFSADNPPDAHMVAELDGAVVGYIRLRPPTHLPENAHVIQIQGIAVHPSARGHGVAAALLANAEYQVLDRGKRKLSLRVLSTNHTAIKVYERMGFTVEGVLREEFMINGRYVDDILMTKHLRGGPQR